MHKIDRPGVSEKWLKIVQKPGKRKSPYAAPQVASQIAALEYFVAHGVSHQQLAAGAIAGSITPKSPPERAWEPYLHIDLHVYGAIRLCDWEIKGLNAQVWDHGLADAAFDAVRLAQLVALYVHMLFPQRFSGRVLRRMSMSSLVFTALGLVNGRDTPALALARAQLAALRRQYYVPDLVFPAACFVARILADYLGQTPLVIKSDPSHLQKGEIRADPVMDALFNAWCNPDAEALRAPLLAACDVHTHHAFTGANSFRREFGNGIWTRTPIAALLVMKLRAMLGLSSPQLDHPLLNTILGKLPVESGHVADPLVEAVHSRMMRDGFDEAEILDHYSRPQGGVAA